MYRGYESYSFKQGRTRTRRIAFVILRAILVTFVLYLVATGALVRSLRMETASMEPVLRTGDRVLATPLVYGLRLPFLHEWILETGRPKRGELIVLEPPYYPDVGTPRSVLDSVVGFFTLQRQTAVVDVTGDRIGRFMIKRVIGLPGDTVRLERFVAYVKPAGQRSYRRETELIEAEYEVSIRPLPEDWPEEAPFSGEMEPILLQEGEYFVLGDNRCCSSDSRSWGPVGLTRIRERVVLRYWPLRNLDPL